jgi:hypothetical protein
MPEQLTFDALYEQAEVEYRPIEGFPGYRIGNDGSVWSCRPCTRVKLPGWRRMRLIPNNHGYLFVQMCLNGKHRKRYAHRLVLEAFVGPCPEGMECRHFPDGDPTNNKLSNLSWATHLENQRDKPAQGTNNDGERNGLAKLTNRDAAIIRTRYATEYVTQQSLADEYGVSNSRISNIITGKAFTAKVPGRETADD